VRPRRRRARHLGAFCGSVVDENKTADGQAQLVCQRAQVGGLWLPVGAYRHQVFLAQRHLGSPLREHRPHIALIVARDERQKQPAPLRRHKHSLRG
jgi:hypothetical protein